MSSSRAAVQAFLHQWPAGPLTHYKTEIPGPQLSKSSASDHSPLVMSRGLGMVSLPGWLPPQVKQDLLTGRAWVLEPKVLGSNPSAGTSSYVGW